MLVLNRAVSELTYEYIVSFCNEGHIEGIQLDYKYMLPAEGLAKHFAAFSNSRGGIIILGVEEDAKTGKPKTFEGLVLDNKVIEKIHQNAASVDPRPVYEVKETNEVSGKVFILVRIFEGDRCPYYKKNDSHLYVRTGNITDPIDQASPEEQAKLFGKAKESALARSVWLSRADEMETAALRDANRQLQSEIERIKQGGGQVTTYTKPLGSDVSSCSITLQPTFPRKPLITPQDLFELLPSLKAGREFLELPGEGFSPAQDGVFKISWSSSDGEVHFEQLYSTGLVRFSVDVRRPYGEQKVPVIFLSLFAGVFFVVLRVTRNYYRAVRYQGGIQGSLTLTNCEAIRVMQLTMDNMFADLEGPYRGLHPKYDWPLELDTTVLFDDKMLQEFFIQTLIDVHWTLGIRSVSREGIERFLDKKGWLAS